MIQKDSSDQIKKQLTNQMIKKLEESKTTTAAIENIL